MNDEVKQAAFVHRSFSILLVAGVLLRFAVFLSASPFNPDRHLEVIDFIVTQHRLPASMELGQAHHPPLYHLLMAPIWAATHSPKALQFVSLVFSLANLLLIAKLLKMLVESPLARDVALSFAAFLPQLVMYGSFVSNDSLTILLGTILFLRGVGYAQDPSTKNAIWLGVVCGLGLLTKGTFLLAPLALMILVFLPLHLVPRGERVGVRGNRETDGELAKTETPPLTPTLSPGYEGEGVKRLRHLAIMLSICLLLGGYKYAENFANYRRPFVHNLDPDTDWKRDQQGQWAGTIARWNLDLVHILREPILKVKHPASYPILMYATFWFPHWPDSSYVANVNGYAWVGQFLYVAGIVPTLLLMVGMFHARFAPDTKGAKREEYRVIHLFAASLLLLNIALVMGVGARFDVWSCFQGRLCFASFTPGLIIFAWAFQFSRWQKILTPFLAAAMLGCLLYFAVEIAFVYELLPPGTPAVP